ncbi:hypothetical protein DV738_g4362, partial [Chaetothyriales sp. CBS 135597]
MAPNSASALSPAELSYWHTSLSSHPPIRADSRSATAFRPLQAETGILPATHGSAHVSFADGSECIVGVKLEAEKTVIRARPTPQNKADSNPGESGEGESPQAGPVSSASWISLTISPSSGTRDDDPTLIYLESMLLEPLTLSNLPERLIINARWHWQIYIDILLISSSGLASYPLPLLSMATHLALRTTRVPRLKSEGEEDPIADDDWMASTYLYARSDGANRARPPLTLLVVTVNENIVFDPSHEEIKVADNMLAISIEPEPTADKPSYKMLSLRMIDTPARDTMQGVPRDGDTHQGRHVPGVWRPRVGGINRGLVNEVVKAVLTAGVADDVINGLDGFLHVEEEADRRTGARAG